MQSYVTKSSPVVSSTTDLNLTIPDSGAGAQVGDLCIAHLYLGSSTNATSAGALPATWTHAYSSPAEIQYGTSPNVYYYAVMAWKILTADDLGQGVTFTRGHTTGDSFRGILTVWRHSLQFHPTDPFLTKLYRATGFSAQSSSNLGIPSVPESGDIAVTWSCATRGSSSYWTDPYGWTNVQLSAGGTDGALDVDYKADPTTNARYAYISNNRWIHWAFTFKNPNYCPLLSNIIPEGSITTSTSIGCDITDESGILSALAVFVSFAGRPCELVYDGTKLRGKYRSLSTVETITDGLRFRVQRDGGWIAAPSLEVAASDGDGNFITPTLVLGDYSSESVQPTITLTPSVDTEIRTNQRIRAVMSDAGGLQVLAIAAVYKDDVAEIVYDGAKIREGYNRSTVSVTGTSVTLDVIPDAGWKFRPTLEFIVSDTSGNVGVFSA